VRGRMKAVTVDVFDFHNDFCHEFGLAHWNTSCDNFVNRREASFLSEMMTACLETTKKCFNSLQVCCLDSTIAGMFLSHLLGCNEEEGYPQAPSTQTKQSVIHVCVCVSNSIPIATHSS
jgi:hypothetical protein